MCPLLIIDHPRPLGKIVGRLTDIIEYIGLQYPINYDTLKNQQTPELIQNNHSYKKIFYILLSPIKKLKKLKCALTIIIIILAII